MKLIGYTIASLLIAVLASAIVWAVWHNVWMAAVSYIVSGNATMFVLVYSSFRAPGSERRSARRQGEGARTRMSAVHGHCG